jgi:hypothetical protein
MNAFFPTTHAILYKCKLLNNPRVFPMTSCLMGKITGKKYFGGKLAFTEKNPKYPAIV